MYRMGFLSFWVYNNCLSAVLRNCFVHRVLLIFIILWNNHFVLPIVTIANYQLDSAALVDIYYTNVSGSLSPNDYSTGNSEENEYNFQYQNSLENDDPVDNVNEVEAVLLLKLFNKNRIQAKPYKYKYNNNSNNNNNKWNGTTSSEYNNNKDLEISPTTFRHLHRLYTIYPGTMWCGIGNLASNDYSIGFFYGTDNCCRLHDKCFDSIPSKKTRHGLTNSGHFTRSHCDCDRKFYQCLKKANSFVSHKIGVTYFNILRPKCFRKEHPIIGCILRRDGLCKTYVIDETKPQVWQWFDNKDF